MNLKSSKLNSRQKGASPYEKKFLKGRNIAKEHISIPIPNFGISTSMPNDAQINFIKITKIADTYALDKVVKNNSQQDDETFKSISDFISDQCGDG